MRRQKNRRLVRRYSGRGADEAPGYALADKIYDLSLALGELRARSIVNVGALRSLAQVSLALLLSLLLLLLLLFLLSLLLLLLL